MLIEPGSSYVLAVCASCNATVDLTATRPTVVDGRVQITCHACLGLGEVDRFELANAETVADTAAPVAETLGTNAALAAVEGDETSAVRADSPVREDTAPAVPISAIDSARRPRLRVRHLASAAAVAAVAGAIALLAPGDPSTPTAHAPAAINVPARTQAIAPLETAAPDVELGTPATATLAPRASDDPSNAAREHRDAIRERKRRRAKARKERGKRVAFKGRRFGRFSLGVLPVSLQGESWIYPLPGRAKTRSTSFGRFGAPRGRYYYHRPSCGRGHCGYDLLGPWNMPIVAVLPGVVERVVWRSRMPSGRYVVIRHEGGLRTWYMHLHRPRLGLRPGMTVNAGEEIGRLGTTGLRDKIPHLHFSLEKADKFYVDPEPFLMAATTIARPRPPAVKPSHRM